MGSALRRAARHPVGRWAVIGWIIVLVGVTVRTAVMAPGARSVYPIFQHAGESWLSHADLYPETQQPPGYPLFRYSPPVANAFVPLAELPTRPGDILWRDLNAVALLGGLAWAIRRLPDPPLSMTQSAAIFLLLLPAAPGGFGNGQCNAMVIGLVLAGYAAAVEQRFTLSAVMLAVATLLKIYPVAPALLLVALYARQLGPRYAIAILLGLGLPFLLADPAYVQRQYELWVHYFANEDRSDWPPDSTNLDLQFVVSEWIAPMSTQGYRVVEAIGGLAFAALTVAAARRFGSADRTAWVAFGLGSVWMTTLGPATESPTYLLLTPAAAIAVVLAWSRRPTDWVGRMLAIIAWALPASFQLAHVSKPTFDAYRTLGPQPVSGLFLVAALVWDTWAVRPATPWPMTEPATEQAVVEA
jgi:hypothetical protein